MFGLKRKKMAELLSPLTGRAVPMTETPDPVFAGKVLGDGVAIQPEDGAVFSPVDGTVIQVAHTLHAVGLQSEDGLEVLVHFGVDTTKLKGEGFRCLVKEGQKVKAGEKIMEMDLNLIQEKGFSLVSPLVITNMDQLGAFQVETGPVSGGKTPVVFYKFRD